MGQGILYVGGSGYMLGGQGICWRVRVYVGESGYMFEVIGIRVHVWMVREKMIKIIETDI